MDGRPLRDIGDGDTPHSSYLFPQGWFKRLFRIIIIQPLCMYVCINALYDLGSNYIPSKI